MKISQFLKMSLFASGLLITSINSDAQSLLLLNSFEELAVAVNGECKISGLEKHESREIPEKVLLRWCNNTLADCKITIHEYCYAAVMGGMHIISPTSEPERIPASYEHAMRIDMAKTDKQFIMLFNVK